MAATPGPRCQPVPSAVDPGASGEATPRGLQLGLLHVGSLFGACLVHGSKFIFYLFFLHGIKFSSIPDFYQPEEPVLPGLPVVTTKTVSRHGPNPRGP